MSKIHQLLVLCILTFANLAYGSSLPEADELDNKTKAIAEFLILLDFVDGISQTAESYAYIGALNTMNSSFHEMDSSGSLMLSKSRSSRLQPEDALALSNSGKFAKDVGRWAGGEVREVLNKIAVSMKIQSDFDKNPERASPEFAQEFIQKSTSGFILDLSTSGKETLSQIYARNLWYGSSLKTSEILEKISLIHKEWLTENAAKIAQSINWKPVVSNLFLQQTDGTFLEFKTFWFSAIQRIRDLAIYDKDGSKPMKDLIIEMGEDIIARIEAKRGILALKEQKFKEVESKKAEKPKKKRRCVVQ